MAGERQGWLATQVAIRWAEIVEACAVRVIAMNQIAEDEDL